MGESGVGGDGEQWGLQGKTGHIEGGGGYNET